MPFVITSAEGLLNKCAVHRPSGRIVRAIECADGVDYGCPSPGCDAVLRARAVDSESVRAHLYHAGDRSCSGARGESEVHAVAKALVVQTVQDWLDGSSPLPPTLVQRCERRHLRQMVWCAGALTVSSEVSTGSGRRVDVMVSGHDWRSAIEVRVTHAVSADKASDLDADEVLWAEVSAADIIAGGPWCFERGSLRLPCRLCGYLEEEGAMRQRAADAQAARKRIEAECRGRIERAKAEAEKAERRASERARLVLLPIDQLTSQADRLARRRAELADQVAAAEDRLSQAREAIAALRVQGSDALVGSHMLAEFAERGAIMRTSGGIVASPGKNSEDFRRRAYGWISAALSIAQARNSL